MNNSALIEHFYQSFADHDAEGMVGCYHPDIEFQDPAFGILQGEAAKNMWRMLVTNNKGKIKISFHDIQVQDSKGSAHWRAEYVFSQTGRKVINHISASFEFADGKIIRHHDQFNLYTWCKQAFGLKGYLLGWSSFMQNQIQKRSNSLLQKYMMKRERESQ